MRRTILMLVLLMTLAPSVALAQDDGLTLPAADPALVFVAPRPEQPNFAVRAELFVQAIVAEPFKSAFESAGGLGSLGLPTSQPVADPHNPNFVYQRFENGVLFHNATEGTTDALV